MYTVAVAKGNNPRKMLEESIDFCGGLSSIFTDKNKRILIKGNFGCHKPSVTGATTDLRVVISLIEMLQREGYSDIVVGDGGMAGYRKVDLLEYLGVNGLCEKYNVPVVDLNKDSSTLVKLRSGLTVRISRTALESNVINLAKLKTHVLVTITMGIKNLMGTVSGTDKRELHLHGLEENLANLPFIVKPNLTIIEGLVGMEGRGPVAGKPKKCGLLVTSRDTIAADIVGSKLIGVDPYGVKHIKYAITMASKSYRWADLRLVGTPFEEAVTPFELGIAEGIETNSYIMLLKQMFRAPAIRPIAMALMSVKLVATIIDRLGILQEKVDHDISLNPPFIESTLCIGCGLCEDVCPANAISIKERKACINPEKCVNCFCCVETCPRGAIKQLCCR